MYHSELNKEETVCGIDIGTSNSTAVLYDGKTMKIIHHHQKVSLPSLVALKKDGKCLIGEPAKSFLQSQKSCCYETKRFFGMTYDEYKQKNYSYPFNVIKGENDMVELELEAPNGEKKRIKPQEVSKMIVEEFIESSKKEYGIEPKNIVVTCPVEFTIDKRDMLKELHPKIIGVTSEPKAAALSYLSINRINNDVKLLLFDFGAGTLDISIVKGNCENITEMEVLKNVGKMLGGANIDICFGEYIDSRLKHDGININMHRIIQKCEIAKKDLSLNPSTVINFEPENLEIFISKEEFIQLVGENPEDVFGGDWENEVVELIKNDIGN